VGLPEGTILWLLPLLQKPISFPKKWDIAYTGSGFFSINKPAAVADLGSDPNSATQRQISTPEVHRIGL